MAVNQRTWPLGQQAVYWRNLRHPSLHPIPDPDAQYSYCNNCQLVFEFDVISDQPTIPVAHLVTAQSSTDPSQTSRKRKIQFSIYDHPSKRHQSGLTFQTSQMHYTDDELFDGDVDASSDVLLTPSIAQRLRILLCGHCLGQSQRNGGYHRLAADNGSTPCDITTPYAYEKPLMSFSPMVGSGDPSGINSQSIQPYHNAEPTANDGGIHPPEPSVPVNDTAQSALMNHQALNSSPLQNLQASYSGMTNPIRDSMTNAPPPSANWPQEQSLVGPVQTPTNTSWQMIHAPPSPTQWPQQQLHAGPMQTANQTIDASPNPALCGPPGPWGTFNALPSPPQHFGTNSYNVSAANASGQSQALVLHSPQSSEMPSNTETFPSCTDAYFNLYVAREQQRLDYDILPPNQKGGRRGPFKDPVKRIETAVCRKVGSCLRCRHQRIRCEKDKENPRGPCKTCLKAAMTRTGIFPCSVYRIKDIKLFKPGQVAGHEWTTRWSNSAALSDRIKSWASSEVKTIRVSEGYSRHCIILRVRKFRPEPGDQVFRSWYHDGVKRSVAVPPFAMMELDEGKKAYEDYIVDCMEEAVFNIIRPQDELVSMTYREAWRLLGHLKQVAPDSQACALLNNTFKLWMSIRLTTTSCFIVGEERLGMAKDILDSTNPTPGRIPVPPMLGAQLDAVLIHNIQVGLKNKVLEDLEIMLYNKRRQVWMVTYLVLFMLLHNAALITAHDAGYAKKHGMQRRFAREEKVREYHFSVKAMLAHFHYCNGGIFPLSEDCRDVDLRTIGNMSDEQIEFINLTRKLVGEHSKSNAPDTSCQGARWLMITPEAYWQQLREEGRYEHDHYFLRQLYEKSWQGGEETI